MVMAYFKVLFQNLSWRIEENHEEPQVASLCIKIWTWDLQIQSGSANHPAVAFGA